MKLRFIIVYLLCDSLLLAVTPFGLAVWLYSRENGRAWWNEWMLLWCNKPIAFRGLNQPVRKPIQNK